MSDGNDAPAIFINIFRATLLSVYTVVPLIVNWERVKRGEIKAVDKESKKIQIKKKDLDKHAHAESDQNIIRNTFYFFCDVSGFKKKKKKGKRLEESETKSLRRSGILIVGVCETSRRHTKEIQRGECLLLVIRHVLLEIISN